VRLRQLDVVFVVARGILPVSTLHIRLLGGFQLTYDDDTVLEIGSKRRRTLLVYLLLYADTPQPRHHVAFLLWPDTNEEQARRNLRRSLPACDQLLDIRDQTVQWRREGPFLLDVAAFEAQVALAQAAIAAGDAPAAISALQAAVEWYRGPLFPGGYEDWVLAAREQLEAAYLRALEQLLDLVEARRDYATAIDYAQRLLRHDPLHEATYRRLMRLHAVNHDRASAMRVYHTCAATLERELGVEPDPDTQALYRRLFKREAEANIRALPSKPSHGALVGRQAEWQRLLSVWRQVTTGQPHLLLITGEAGIGKTRLAEELVEWVGRQGIATARAQSYAAEGELVYAPVIEWLRADGLQPALAHLEPVWLTEVARLLPELLAEHSGLRHPEPLTANWQRQRLFEGLARACLVERQPKLLLLDDLHWCDLETLAWLRFLLHFDAQAPLLIVGTVRVEEVTPNHALTDLVAALSAHSQVTDLAVEPLNLDDTTALAEQVLGRELDAPLRARFFAETQGNPLFIVEMARADVATLSPLLPAGLPGRALPPKVYATIQARLVHLSPLAGELVQLAAAIGRSFIFDLLVHASKHGEDELVEALDELWQRRIIRAQGLNAYDFSHDRIREVAYAGISPVRRPPLHRRIAQALESVFAANLDAVSPQIAAHYAQAGIEEKAILYYRRGAEAAQRLYAYREAVEYLTKGIALLESLPESPERRQCEMEMQLTLGSSWMFVEGRWTAPEVISAYRRAQILSKAEPTTPQHFLALWGLHQSYIQMADLDRTQGLAERLLTVGLSIQEPVYVAIAHFLVGQNLFLRGEFALAQKHLERSCNSSVPLERDFQVLNVRHAPAVIGRAFGAETLWYLGYPDRALQLSSEALALARDMRHPLELTFMLFQQAVLHQLRCEPQPARELATEAIYLGSEHDIPAYRTLSTIILGWTLVEEGKIEEGISHMNQGLTMFQKLGMELRKPYALRLLAQANSEAGELQRGLEIVGEAMSVSERTGQNYHLAELYRLRGELLAKRGALQKEIELCFHRALAIARRQQAKSLELRAAMNTARLGHNQGKAQQAYALLKPTRDWFTEGFDTPDLRQADELLRHIA
jgi:DNA-binding SARP family transcriptional activator